MICKGFPSFLNYAYLVGQISPLSRLYLIVYTGLVPINEIASLNA